MERPDGVDSEKVEVDAKANEIDVEIETIKMMKEKQKSQTLVSIRAESMKSMLDRTQPSLERLCARSGQCTRSRLKFPFTLQLLGALFLLHTMRTSI